jgi:hypothetical protein
MLKNVYFDGFGGTDQHPMFFDRNKLIKLNNFYRVGGISVRDEL